MNQSMNINSGRMSANAERIQSTTILDPNITDRSEKLAMGNDNGKTQLNAGNDYSGGRGVPTSVITPGPSDAAMERIRQAIREQQMAEVVKGLSSRLQPRPEPKDPMLQQTDVATTLTNNQSGMIATGGSVQSLRQESPEMQASMLTPNVTVRGGFYSLSNNLTFVNRTTETLGSYNQGPLNTGLNAGVANILDDDSSGAIGSSGRINNSIQFGGARLLDDSSGAIGSSSGQNDFQLKLLK